MTQRHYAQPSSVANAATARVLGILDTHGGSGPATARALAERLKRRLDAETRELLARPLVEPDDEGASPA